MEKLADGGVVSELDKLLLETDQLIRKREYQRVIDGIEPLRKQWKAHPAEAPGLASRLLLMLGSAYRGLGQQGNAWVVFDEAAGMGMGRDDSAFGAALMEAAADLSFEMGNVERAIEWSRASLAFTCTELLTQSLTNAEGPRFENPGTVRKLAGYLAAAGQWSEAQSMLAVAREIYEARCDFRGLGQVFDAMARMAKIESDVVRARKLVGQALLMKWIARDETIEQSYGIIDLKGAD